MPSRLDRLWRLSLEVALVLSFVVNVVLGMKLWLSRERLDLLAEQAELHRQVSAQAVRYANLQERLDVSCRAALLDVLKRVGVTSGPVRTLADLDLAQPTLTGVGGE